MARLIYRTVDGMKMLGKSYRCHSNIIACDIWHPNEIENKT